MKIAGIIAEYNPFHNGHKYQIDKIKETHDAVIAVMSGHFMQRGDIAITDKWTRAKSAVKGGCDLVIELPVCYSLNSAAEFARGGVTLLDKLKVTNSLFFGSECGNTATLIAAAKITLNEPPEISDAVKKYAAEGMSYPVAYTKAYEGIIDADILSKPNNILALEYIKAIMTLNSSIIPVTVKRTGAEHNSSVSDADFASASHIRELIKSGVSYSSFVPDSAYEIYKSADMTYDISQLNSFITGTLRLHSADFIQRTYDVSEGLENRIKKAVSKYADFESICAAVKTKRYTLSRIRRILLAASLSLPAAGDINYARVLAMNDTGKEILKMMKKRSDIDIITKIALYEKENKMLSADILATDIFSLCSSIDAHKTGGRDFTTSPIIL